MWLINKAVILDANHPSSTVSASILNNDKDFKYIIIIISSINKKQYNYY